MHRLSPWHAATYLQHEASASGGYPQPPEAKNIMVFRVLSQAFWSFFFNVRKNRDSLSLRMGRENRGRLGTGSPNGGTCEGSTRTGREKKKEPGRNRQSHQRGDLRAPGEGWVREKGRLESRTRPRVGEREILFSQKKMLEFLRAGLKSFIRRTP
jgi:hypothetical protein